jgi:hypothetical protein
VGMVRLRTVVSVREFVYKSLSYWNDEVEMQVYLFTQGRLFLRG